MLPKPRVRLVLAVALMGLALLLLPAVASADTVTNNVGANAIVAFPHDGSATVKYRIMAKNNDGQKQCNFNASSPALLTIEAPDDIIVDPPVLTFNKCKTWQSVTFRAKPTAREDIYHTVTVRVTGTGPGTYATPPATIRLRVLRPFDVDAPLVNVTFPAPPKGANGWYTAKPVVGTVVVTDPNNVVSLECFGGALPASLPLNAPLVTTSITVDQEGANLVTCVATDQYGSYGAAPGSSNWADVDIDTLPPTVVPSPDRDANAAGWYNQPVTISFDGEDDASGVSDGSCDTAVTYSGPDTAKKTVSGKCTDDAGNQGTGAFDLSYDATRPQVTLAAGRAPDANGWYNHALAISASAMDNLSGVAGCDPQVSYAGPDSGTASKTLTCTDTAGNTGTGTLNFKYDCTAPRVTAAANRKPDWNGAYIRPVTITFEGADALAGIASCTAPIVYSGPPGRSASVSGTCTDKAGNTSNPVAFTFQFLKPIYLPLTRR